MKRNFCSVLCHAFRMVVRRIKTYAFLSVTIILSFSFLLGYLMFTDSQSYNEYKELFQRRRGDVVISENTGRGSSAKSELLMEQLDKMEDTVYFTAYSASFGAMRVSYDAEAVGGGEGTSFYFANLYALFLPDGAWLDLIEDWTYASSNEIVWLQENRDEAFSLQANEVILSEKLYFALGLDKESQPVFRLRTDRNLNTELKVVGYAKSAEPIDYSKDSWVYTPTMFLSVKFMDFLDKEGVDLWAEQEVVISRRLFFVHTERPEKIVALAKTMEYSSVYSVYEEQDAAMEQIQSQVGNKAIIACALLVLLGINLYSSFSNAMNERKFEIGVKRAVGASAWSIVRQFLYESLMVMVANVIISIALVVDIGVLYKIIVEWQSGFLDTYVLYLSPHSMVIFGACAVTLTVVFSLIFAYKSTQVEIVQYLKAE